MQDFRKGNKRILPPLPTEYTKEAIQRLRMLIKNARQDLSLKPCRLAALPTLPSLLPPPDAYNAHQGMWRMGSEDSINSYLGSPCINTPRSTWSLREAQQDDQNPSLSM